MTTSGVNPTLYTAYAFDDHIWSINNNRRPDLLELARRCIKIDKGYWLRLPNTDVWTDIGSMTDAKKAAKNSWLSGILASGTLIDAELIDTFFDGVEMQSQMIGKKVVTKPVDVGSCPYLQGRLIIPYGPQFITYQGEHYLNASTIEVIKGEVAHLRLGQLVLVMIYRALCNGAQLHADKVIEGEQLFEQIVSNRYGNPEFRFVMNWLAAIVQRPGCNLQTNLWFVGEQQGVGKGTLLSIMGRIIKDGVGALNQTEIEAGWNDHLFGKCLIEINEFDTTQRMTGKAWNKWLKQHTCEPEMPIRQRHTTSWNTINIGNYMATSNELIPFWLDRYDRRNQMVKTTDDVYWRDAGSVIQVEYLQPHGDALAAGFACVLEQVKVDHDLIKSAFLNQIKADVQEAGQSQAADWSANDATIQLCDPESPAGWHKTETYYDRFATWVSSTGEKPVTAKKWARDMGKLANVERRTNPDTRHREYRHVVGGEEIIVDRNRVGADFRGYGATTSPIDDQAVQTTPPDKLTPSKAALQRMREGLRALKD